MKKNGYLKQLSIFALFAWMLVLVKFILFKHQTYVYRNYFRNEFPSYTISVGWAKANLIPFKNIIDIIVHNEAYVYGIGNIYGNIAGFIPVGILIPLAFPAYKTKRYITAIAVAISFFFECIQLILGTGIVDIDDLILNGLGGYIGSVLSFIYLNYKKNVLLKNQNPTNLP